MKFVSSQIAFFFQKRDTKTNFRSLAKFLIALILLVTVYSLLFHLIMLMEGRDYTYVTGFYWTLTVMSTLGLGDITFETDLGRLFSIVVLMSGIVFLLVLLPFTFIQFFYAPWLEAQKLSKTPRELPAAVKDHVIIVGYDKVMDTLIEKLISYNTPYYLLISDQARALELHDLGFKVVLGDYDDPQTYRRINGNKALLLVAAQNDMVNTNITFTFKEVAENVPVVAMVKSEDSIDILKLAGCDNVIYLPSMLGQSLARRTMGESARVHVLGRIDELIIGEAPVLDTPLVGKTLASSRMREIVGVNVIGFWERGKFQPPHPDTVINEHTILVMAGTIEQLRNYNEYFGIFHAVEGGVMIIGGGRVGRACAKALEVRQMDYVIVEKNPAYIKNPDKYVLGNAADYHVLKKAGIDKVHTVIITSNEDEMNIYLTLYFRKLRPDLKITSRSTLERNVSTLHRAGADFVMSYASMGANAIFNVLENNDVLMLAEGLNVFRYETPRKIVGKNLIETAIRKKTGCSVIGIQKDDKIEINPQPEKPFEENTVMILIGTLDSERKFISYMSGK
ncbi:MAG: potassium channel protein [Balneolaceae bacterium]|nr:MAG: potassium channel protein [Balneolaceae bacterium]